MRKNHIRQAMVKLHRFLYEPKAATAVEYAFMLAMMILVMFGAIVLLGEQVNAKFALVVDGGWQN